MLKDRPFLLVPLLRLVGFGLQGLGIVVPPGPQDDSVQPPPIFARCAFYRCAPGVVEPGYCAWCAWKRFTVQLCERARGC